MPRRGRRAERARSRPLPPGARCHLACAQARAAPAGCACGQTQQPLEQALHGVPNHSSSRGLPAPLACSHATGQDARRRCQPRCRCQAFHAFGVGPAAACACSTARSLECNSPHWRAAWCLPSRTTAAGFLHSLNSQGAAPLPCALPCRLVPLSATIVQPHGIQPTRGAPGGKALLPGKSAAATMQCAPVPAAPALPDSQNRH